MSTIQNCGITQPSQIMPTIHNANVTISGHIRHENTDPDLCTRIYNHVTKGLADEYSRIEKGIAFGGFVITPLAAGLTFLYEGEDVTTLLKKALMYFYNRGGNAQQEILQGRCFWQSLTTNINIQNFLSGRINVFTLNGLLESSYIKAITVSATVIAGISGELLFRGLFQEMILKRLPKSIINSIAPGKESILDTKIAKVARVVLTAVVNTLAVRVFLDGAFPSNFLNQLLLSGFVKNIGLSVLKESKAGIVGSLFAQTLDNLIFIAPLLGGC